MKARLGGLVAAAGAAALVVPLLAAAPAQAAGTADLSITKTVARTTAPFTPPITFSPTRQVLLAHGYEEWVPGGLRIRTDANDVSGCATTCTNKVAEYVDSNVALDDVGNPSLEFASTSGQLPGYQLVVDLDGNGSKDAILVGEYGIWWAAELTDTALQALAPQIAGPGNTIWQGPLAAWQAAFPDAVVQAYGFSLGRGAGAADHVLSAINFAGVRHDLSRTFQDSVTAAPGETVEYKITVTNSLDATAEAIGIRIEDVLPADLTYVDGTLSRPDWCGFSGQTLTCTGGNLPIGTASTVTFKAKVSETADSSTLPSTIGHNIDVQKQEVFADLPAGTSKTYTAMCPSGYIATDGGLLVDAVDPDGFYSDIVVMKSQPVVIGGIEGWKVTATNLGEQRGQGKAKVTCLDGSLGSSNGHTHDVNVAPSTTHATLAWAASNPTNGETLTASCPAGYTPIAPQFDITSGVAVVRSSIANGNQWKWVVDHEDGTAGTFDVDCLAPGTGAMDGHTATLPISTTMSTISIGAESRDEGVQQCSSTGHAITGGYDGKNVAVLSLGKEPRGTNYMFRFYNDDWAQAWNADIQVTCVAVRTADEEHYHQLVNTATVSMVGAGVPADLSSSDNSSSASITLRGDAVQAPGGVVVGPNGSRTGTAPNVRKVNLRITCLDACAFTVKVLQGGSIVAKATKSFPGSPNERTVLVPTTSAGRNLANNDVVTVKVKTSMKTTTTQVTL